MKTFTLAVLSIALLTAQTGHAADCDTASLKKAIQKARKDGTLVQFYETAPRDCPEYANDAGSARLRSLVNDVRRENEGREARGGGAGGGGGGRHH